MGSAARRRRSPITVTNTLAALLFSVWSPILLVSSSGAQSLPWRTWEDLHRIAQVYDGHQSLLLSSHCPDGCRFDRHSDGDWRYLYVDGDEGVVFEQEGPGAIARIWMTMGEGTSLPLTPDVRMKIYLDGSSVPVVDEPLPALFDGTRPPFVAPLVGHRLTSSGGNFSYVPIPYRKGCRIVLTGAEEQRIWFQVNYHRLTSPTGIITFTGNEDLSLLTNLFELSGTDPWPPNSGVLTSGTQILVAGGEIEIFSSNRAGSLTALLLELDPLYWDLVELQISFDGHTTVQLRLSDLFAIGRGGSSPTRALLLGRDDLDTLYSYFPMPYFQTVSVKLRYPALIDQGSVEVSYQVRNTQEEPAVQSGHFGVTLSQTSNTTLGEDFLLFALSGQGKVVGTFQELGSTDPVRNYLEGDERFFVDYSSSPSIYGTGVEDYFNGGFFFDSGPFSEPLHGAPYTELVDSGSRFTAAYRLLLTDSITFASHLRAGLESGPTNNLSMQARSVTYVYRKPTESLYLWDELDLGDALDRQEHQYQVETPFDFHSLDGLFEGEPPKSRIATGVYRPPGMASFSMSAHPTSTRLRLRRLLDAGESGQRATIIVNGATAGFAPFVGANSARRWREIDIDLSAQPNNDGSIEIFVLAEEGPGASGIFTAFEWQLWANGPGTVFGDGFESGDLRHWIAPQSVQQGLETQ